MLSRKAQSALLHLRFTNRGKALQILPECAGVTRVCQVCGLRRALPLTLITKAKNGRTINTRQQGHRLEWQRGCGHQNQATGEPCPAPSVKTGTNREVNSAIGALGHCCVEQNSGRRRRLRPLSQTALTTQSPWLHTSCVCLEPRRALENRGPRLRLRTVGGGENNPKVRYGKWSADWFLERPDGCSCGTTHVSSTLEEKSV